LTYTFTKARRGHLPYTGPGLQCNNASLGRNLRGMIAFQAFKMHNSWFALKNKLS
jgi:hypothetical protein